MSKSSYKFTKQIKKCKAQKTKSIKKMKEGALVYGLESMRIDIFVYIEPVEGIQHHCVYTFARDLLFFIDRNQVHAPYDGIEVKECSNLLLLVCCVFRFHHPHPNV